MKLSDLPKHHAVLIAHSERENISESLWNELASDSLSHNYFKQTVLDIDTVRKLISFANSSQSGNRTALISFHTATLPAQNAMLKILEEPRAGVSFILVTSNRENLIPTVISRVHEIKQKAESRKQNEEYAEEFFKTKPTERMELGLVKEILNKEDEEKRKDREGVRNFILSLGEFARNKKEIKGSDLMKIEECVSYASDASASGKMLLEFLSLLLPQIF